MTSPITDKAPSPTDAVSCHDAAIECAKRAEKLWASGKTLQAKLEIERARHLCLRALEFEQGAS